MNQKIIDKIIGESDKTIMVLISQTDKALAGIVEPVAESGTPEQKQALKIILEQKLQLLNA